jgi:hypothetical protein
MISHCAHRASTVFSCALWEHGDRPSYPIPLFSILLGDDVAHKIVERRIGDLDLDKFPCRC